MSKKFSEKDGKRRIIESLHSLAIRLQDFQKQYGTEPLKNDVTIQTQLKFLTTYSGGIIKN